MTKLLIVVGPVIVVADVVGLPYEGVLAGLGVGGIALAFATRDTVDNVMGGGILMADRPFKRGDLIEHGGTLDTAEQVGLCSTKLRALDDTLLHVLNSQLSNQKIANWGKRRRRKQTLQVGLTYHTPREKLAEFAENMLTLLRAAPAVDNDDIYVGLSAFGDSSIDIDMIYFFRVDTFDEQVNAQHQLVLDIVALAEEIDVGFAFPTRTLFVASAKLDQTVRDARFQLAGENGSRSPSAPSL